MLDENGDEIPFVKQCTIIEHCEPVNYWYNSCSSCLKGYSFEYISSDDSIDTTTCVSNVRE